MQQEEGLVILIMLTLLGICFFGPSSFTVIEAFTNTNNKVKYNPTGAIRSYMPLDSDARGVDQVVWKPGNMTNTLQRAYGPRQSLDLQPNTLAQFPFMEQSKRENNETIRLINGDGVPLGAYRHQIIRPFDNTTPKSENPKMGMECKWPCYSDLKHEKWCDESNAIKYHAMRPLLNPQQYNDLLKQMFRLITDHNVPMKLTPNDSQFTSIQCTYNVESIMKWLMGRVALAVSKMPAMHKNSTWGVEQFSYTDVQPYQFISDNGQVHFKIVFNLYNALRSTATLVVAHIYLQGSTPLLQKIDFVNNEEMTDFTGPQNGWGPINGQNITGDIEQFEPLGVPESPDGMRTYKKQWMNDPNEFDWLYQNTLPVQKFNQYGFYSNELKDNLDIKGGVPDSLKKQIRSCSNDQLSACYTPAYNGYANGQPVKPDGNPHNVQVNPQPIYAIPTMSLRDAKIDTTYPTETIIGKVWT